MLTETAYVVSKSTLVTVANGFKTLQEIIKQKVHTYYKNWERLPNVV